MFSGGSSQPTAAAPEAVQYQQGAQHSAVGAQEEPTGPCSWEIKQFLKCAQDQSDLALCSGFNEAIRQCKETHSMFQTSHWCKFFYPFLPFFNLLFYLCFRIGLSLPEEYFVACSCSKLIKSINSVPLECILIQNKFIGYFQLKHWIVHFLLLFLPIL